MNIHVPENAIRRLYYAVIITAVFLLVMTALSDLKVPFATTKLAMQADLKEEAVFAAWFSSFLLLLNAAAALCIAHSGASPQTTTRLFRWTWTAIATGFLALSIDETSQIHERAAYVFSLVVGRIPYLTDQFVIFGWLVLFLPLIVVFVVGMIVAARTWFAFHSRSRTLALAGLTCWIGVLIAEFVEAQMFRAGLERSLQGVIEEGLEVVGSTLFLFSFLEYLKTVHRTAPRNRNRETAGVADHR